MNAKIKTDCIDANEKLTRDELLLGIGEMKKANDRLKQETEILTWTLDKQINEIYGLEVERQGYVERIDILCENMVGLEKKRSFLEASLRVGMPIKSFTNKKKASNHTHFSLYKKK